MRLRIIGCLLCAPFGLYSQDNTLELLRNEINRVRSNPSTDLSDPAARTRDILRLPLNADPKLSPGEIQSAQTTLLRLNNMLNAEAERAARSAEPQNVIIPNIPRLQIYSPPAAIRSATPNLALAKPTRQSSIRYYPSRGGVDGRITGTMGFSTELEPKPWWDVDLQQAAKITEIRVYNSRIEPERARTLEVLLSEDGVRWKAVYTHSGTVFGANGRPLMIPLDGVSARWVRLQLAEPNRLQLDEIEVYSKP